MDDLKQSVQQARHEQKDPLLVYKLESFNLFRDMIDRLNQETVEFLVKGAIPVEPDAASVQNKATKQSDNYAQASVNEAVPSGGCPQKFEVSKGYDKAMVESQHRNVQ